MSREKLETVRKVVELNAGRRGKRRLKNRLLDVIDSDMKNCWYIHR